MDVSQIMELLLSENGTLCFAFGYLACMLCDLILSIIHYFVESALTSHSFRKGRLLPFEWLQNDDIRYFVGRQIYDMDFKTGAVEIEKQDEVLDHLKRKYKDNK